MPGGYSSLGGQVRNPYAPQLNADGIPILSPGGSSSGSAVAVAAGFVTAAIGTETSGSLLSPANQNGIVTVKPTVGLISRAGIVPIARSQDTVGPLTRSVRDAAILLNALAASDPEDDATLHLQRPADYTSVLDKDGLRGARIGIPSDPNSPANDVYYGPLAAPAAAITREVRAVLEDLGVTLVHANVPATDWTRDSDLSTSILKLYPNGLTRCQLEQRPILYLAELKHGLNAYLHDWAKGTSIHTMADIIAFNAANRDRALRFGQEIFLAAERSRDDADTITRVIERCMDIRAMHARTIDTYMDLLRLDAVLFPGHAGAGLAAKAGYPCVHVPAGMIRGVDATSTPDHPSGATFMGRAWSEPVLLRLAYAFEQATKARRMPQSVPPIVPDCGLMPAQ